MAKESAHQVAEAAQQAVEAAGVAPPHQLHIRCTSTSGGTRHTLF